MNQKIASNIKLKGSVRPRPNKDNVKYFDVTIELGTDETTGKRKRLYFRINTTDRIEAENFLEEKKVELRKGELVEPNKITVSQYLDEYMENYVRVHNAPATISDYSGVIESYIKPAFGHFKLQDLTLITVQKVYNTWKQKSPLSDKPLKEVTIRHINRVFKASLNVAIDWGYIKENPVKKVKISKDVVTDTIDVYTLEEIVKLLQAVKGTDMELSVALLLEGMLRRGELLGLKYSDIDFDTNTITIQHSWTEGADGNPILKDCKTQASHRKIVVSDNTMKLIKRQQLRYRQNRLRYGEDFGNSNRVICKEDGYPYLPKSYTHKWEKMLKKNGLRHIKLHGIRHSAISLLVSEGIPINFVQACAGHKDAKVTLGVYTHVAKDKKNVVADKWDSLLRPASNEN